MIQLNEMIMKQMNTLIAALQYRIQRYHSVGNGVMCQNLSIQLRRLQNSKTEAQ